MKPSWKVTGDLELAHKMARLGKNPAVHIRPAVSKGLTVLQRSIRGIIPVRNSRTHKGGPGIGAINKSIIQSIGQKIQTKGTKEVIAKVGVSVGTSHSKKLGLDKRQAIARLAYIAGTKMRQTQSGKNRGMIRKKDYVTRGATSAMSAALKLINDDLHKRLDKALLKQSGNSTMTLVP